MTRSTASAARVFGAIDDAVAGVAFIVAAIVLAFEDGEQRAEDRHPARR